MRVAVINLQSNKVENVGVVDDGDGSKAPDGYVFVISDSANIGDGWDGANIIPQPQPPVPPRL